MNLVNFAKSACRAFNTLPDRRRLRVSAATTALALAALCCSTASTAACVDCHNSLETGAHDDFHCESCHGDSAAHQSFPMKASPDTSFGPRWSAPTAQQDEPCLECHQRGVASHWDEALHMANNVTCVSCHDVHASQDPVRANGGQVAVCTVCHKTQKTGIHGRRKMLGMNPPCTQCHNPHADQRPQAVMLANDSAGCRRCHKLDKMAESGRVSDKARAYHRAMDSTDTENSARACIACHTGVAHGDPDASELFLPLPKSEQEVTLFYPGKSDADWLISEHPGSQPLRQGSNCRQCHRGEEASLGAALGGAEPATRSVSVRFTTGGDRLLTELAWPGAADDTGIALMWSLGDNDSLRRGGCWAACHRDMPGMTLDQGGGVDKYLWDALEQRRMAGRPAILKSEQELAAEIAAGNFAEFWRVDLQRSEITVSTLLSGISDLAGTGVTAEVSFGDGKWSVTISRPLAPPPPLQPIKAGRTATFGIALHGMGRAGREHWVSLPMTLSMDGDDTDFITD